MTAVPFRPTRAMILAAGLGTRMRPLTETTPKVLVEVAGHGLIDRILDRLEEEGVETVVVNLHHLGDRVAGHLDGRRSPEILFSREEELLDTGGGVARALPLLGEAPFYVVLGDSLWLNGPTSALARMRGQWDGEAMDGLLLLHATVCAFGYDGPGDFMLEPGGAIARRSENLVSPYAFAGVQLLHPRLFAAAPRGPFSMRLLWDRAMAGGRLHGLVHDGEWFHVGSLEGRAAAEAFLGTRYPETRRR